MADTTNETIPFVVCCRLPSGRGQAVHLDATPEADRQTMLTVALVALREWAIHRLYINGDTSDHSVRGYVNIHPLSERSECATCQPFHSESPPHSIARLESFNELRASRHHSLVWWEEQLELHRSGKRKMVWEGFPFLKPEDLASHWS